jgi:hypothetical protein
LRRVNSDSRAISREIACAALVDRFVENSVRQVSNPLAIEADPFRAGIPPCIPDRREMVLTVAMTSAVAQNTLAARRSLAPFRNQQAVCSVSFQRSNIGSRLL